MHYSIQPSYKVCAFTKATDEYISGSVLSGNAWEGDISKLLGRLLDAYGNSQMVFIDVGANIGCHALYEAAKGYDVWAVDPLTMNHVKVCCWLI